MAIYVFLAVYSLLAAAAVLWLSAKPLLQRVFYPAHRQPPRSEPTPETLEVVFTLVHGTWAKDAAWTRDGSAFTAALYAITPGRVLIERSPWSGRNSIGARKRATERLRLHLEKVTTTYPLAQHFIVAHSHGGNIALYALNEPRLANKVDGVVCLSTPFLNVRERGLGGIKRSGLLAAVIVVPMFSYALLFDLVLPNHEGLNLAIALGVALIVGFTLVQKAASVAKRLSQSLRLPVLPIDRLLIVRTPGDEASAALSALQLGSWLATQCWMWPITLVRSVTSTIREWSALAWARWKLALSMVLIGATVALGSTTVFTDQTLTKGFIGAGSVIAACGGVIFLIAWAGSGAGIYGSVFSFISSGLMLFPLLVILAVLVVPFGWELAIACTRLGVTVEATPPGTWVVHQLAPIDVEEKGTEMSHAATHERAEAIATVASWVRSKLLTFPPKTTAAQN